MSFRSDVLVMLSLCIFYTFQGFSNHFLCHVICARSDLDCRGMAQPHVLNSERSEKLQQKTAEKSVAIWSYILIGFWHHFKYMLTRKYHFWEQAVVHESECEKGVPKR